MAATMRRPGFVPKLTYEIMHGTRYMPLENYLRLATNISQGKSPSLDMFIGFNRDTLVPIRGA